MTDGLPQPTPKLIQRLRRHARVWRRFGAQGDLLGPVGEIVVSEHALRAMANVADQAAGRLEDFLTAHGSDVMPASDATHEPD